MVKFYQFVQNKLKEISLVFVKENQYFIDGKFTRMIICDDVYAMKKSIIDDKLYFCLCNKIDYHIIYSNVIYFDIEQMCEKYPEFKTFYVFNMDMFE